MAIFIPRWERWKNKRPSGPQQINWNSGLTRGLTFLTGFGPNDLVGNLPETLSVDVKKLSADGVYNFTSRTATSNQGVTFGDNHDYPTATGMSSTVVVKASSWTMGDTNSLGGLIGKSEASGLAGRWGTYIAGAKLEAFVGGNAGVNRLISVTHNLLPNKTHIITWASLESAGTDYLYVDGSVVGSTTSLVNSVAGTTLPLRIGAYSNVTDYFGRFLGEIPLAFIHARKLTHEEAYELGQYPYQLLKPKNQLFIISQGQSANVTLTTVNPTIAVGASQLQHANVALTTVNPTIAVGASQLQHTGIAITTANPVIIATLSQGQSANVTLTRSCSPLALRCSRD